MQVNTRHLGFAGTVLFAFGLAGQGSFVQERR